MVPRDFRTYQMALSGSKRLKWRLAYLDCNPSITLMKNRMENSQTELTRVTPDGQIERTDWSLR